jgi:hypothetical protein
MLEMACTVILILAAQIMIVRTLGLDEVAEESPVKKERTASHEATY